MFADYSWYFRNALVRANYKNSALDIDYDYSFLDKFFQNLLMGTKHELKNRYMVIAAPDGWNAQNNTHEIKNDTQGVENDTQALKYDTRISDIPTKVELDKWIEIQIRKNPKITTEKLASMSQRSIITIKRHIAKLDNIRFVGSGFSGHWEVVNEENNE